MELFIKLQIVYSELVKYMDKGLWIHEQNAVFSYVETSQALLFCFPEKKTGKKISPCPSWISVDAQCCGPTEYWFVVSPFAMHLHQIFCWRKKRNVWVLNSLYVPTYSMTQAHSMTQSKWDGSCFHNWLYFLNWVFHDRRFCQIIWQIFTAGKSKKKMSSKIAPSGVWNQDLRICRPMPYQLS